MLKLEDKEQVKILWIDTPQKKVNLLDRSMMEQMEKVLHELEQSKDETRGLIITSRKRNCFIAGADIQMITGRKSEEEARMLSETGQGILNRLASLPFTTVAAINGACLGGGLELALACDYRVATDESHTKLGLPEVKLGLLPGAGGTVRLPGLIGLQEGLTMLLTGKTSNAQKAKKQGLVDDVVHPGILLQVAKELALKEKPRKRNGESYLHRMTKLMTEENAAGRKIILDRARKFALEKTKGLYPAPERILQVVSAGLNEGAEEGMRQERMAFGELVMSPEARNLIWLFNCEQEMEKENEELIKKAGTKVQKVGVVGGGLMGAGISYVSAYQAGALVRLKDLGEEELAESLSKIKDLFEYQRKKGHMDQFLINKNMSLIAPTTSKQGMENVDLVIEAVFEDPELKRKIYKELEGLGNRDQIMATNTSTIPLAELSKELKRPERFIGMHYFSPVEKMALLEVVKGAKSGEETWARAVEFGMRQGKKVVTVNDGCGFYTSRVLAFYLSEAIRCLREGNPIEKIDEALVEIGFPMGPFELVDSVGIKVTKDISGIIQKHFPKRFGLALELGPLLEQGLKGISSGKGFYLYKNGEKSKVNEDVYELLDLKLRNNKEVDKEMIAKRCLYQFCNESVWCLQDGILNEARDGDFASVYGLGFPPFKGGPFHMMDSLGLDNFLQELEEFRQRDIMGFEPPAMLKEMASKNNQFFGHRP